MIAAMETIMKIGQRSLKKNVTPPSRVALEIASEADRLAIYRMRHDVYAREIGQHAVNEAKLLSDALDGVNVYLVAKIGTEIVGFVSLTPPAAGSYSIDKYFGRAALPFMVNEGLYEVRLLTVQREHRGSRAAAMLMYAAFRWIESHGGTQIMAIGRHEVLSVYLKAGLIDCEMTVQSGAVHYHLLHGNVEKLRGGLDAGSWPVDAIEKSVSWKLGIPLRKPAACFHGGAFFDAIGPRFDHLEKARNIINTDVLDAWFPPAPAVLHTLNAELPWLLRTSPPTGCEGLTECIANARGIKPENVLAGAGSSDLIFLSLLHWLNQHSRVLLLDPTYGEYAHVLEKVIGCRVDRFPLLRERGYEVCLDHLAVAFAEPYDLIILVNPNSPTGRHLSLATLAWLMDFTRPSTRVWIDETYVDFVDPAQSMEPLAAQSENLIVCKSMSKAYALSGARVAYLCASPHQLEELRARTPPWAVSLLGQVAAVRALESPDYYAERWRETGVLREELSAGLSRLGWDIVPGVANFLLCHLPETGPTAATLVEKCGAKGLFMRDAKRMGANLGSHAVRLAVKDAATNQRMIELLTGTWTNICSDRALRYEFTN